MISRIRTPDVLCVIAARGGSKGVPRKNVRELAGLPLITHTLRQARRLFDTVVLSTDDREIAEIGNAEGVPTPFVRPKALASDSASKVPVLSHATREMEKALQVDFAVVIDLQPTSPLRADQDVLAAFDLFKAKPDADNVVSVVESHANPYFNQVQLQDGRMHLVSRAGGYAAPSAGRS